MAGKNNDRNVSFSTMKDVIKYIETHKYSEDALKIRTPDATRWVTRLDLACAYLIYHREKNDIFMVNKIINDLCSNCVSISVVKSITHTMYNYYGIDELECVYEDINGERKLECEEHMLNEERNAWKTISWEYILNSLLGNIKYSTGPFIGNFFRSRLYPAYKEWFIKIAQRYYPEVDEYRVKTYVKMRKASNYQVTLNMPNQKIIEVCAANDHKVSFKTCNKLKSIFGYPQEIDGNALLKKYDSVALAFYARTGADKLEDEDIIATCKYIQKRMRYSYDEMKSLINWLYRAKNEGYSKNDGIKVPASLKERYDADVDRIALFRMRSDIAMSAAPMYSSPTMTVITSCGTAERLGRPKKLQYAA